MATQLFFLIRRRRYQYANIFLVIRAITTRFDKSLSFCPRIHFLYVRVCTYCLWVCVHLLRACVVVVYTYMLACFIKVKAKHTFTVTGDSKALEGLEAKYSDIGPELRAAPRSLLSMLQQHGDALSQPTPHKQCQLTWWPAPPQALVVTFRINHVQTFHKIITYVAFVWLHSSLVLPTSWSPP